MPKTDNTAPAGAFGKDKLYGNRLDEAFAERERFLLLAGRIADELVPTELGEAKCCKLLVQELDEDTAAPKGKPYVVNTLASAIVEKIEQLQEGELPAIVEWRTVKSRFNTDATVLQYVAGLDDEDVFAEFGVDAADVERAIDKARPAGDRMPAGF